MIFTVGCQYLNEKRTNDTITMALFKKTYFVTYHTLKYGPEYTLHDIVQCSSPLKIQDILDKKFNDRCIITDMSKL